VFIIRQYIIFAKLEVTVSKKPGNSAKVLQSLMKHEASGPKSINLIALD